MAIFYAAADTGEESNAPQIYTVPAGFWDNYFIKYLLTPENTVLTRNEGEEFRFRDGGFEIYIPREAFPIAGPEDEDLILVIMPRTFKKAPDRETANAEKKALFEKIKTMRESGEGQVEVIIQLSPYVTVTQKEPLKLKLDSYIVFFRNRHGRYINHTEPFEEISKDGNLKLR